MRLVLALALWAGTAIPAETGSFISFNETVHGEVLALNKGKVVLFDFWATWCAPCRAEMPLLVELEKKLRDEGFVLVTVSADEPTAKQAAIEFLQQHNVPAPVYFKSVADEDRFIDAIDKSWFGALPALFVYNRNGKLVKSFIGETPIGEIEKAIRAAL